MLVQRLIVAIILVPVGVFLIAMGGWVLAGLVIAVLGYGAWEYWRLFTQGGYHPSAPVIIAGVVGLALFRQLFQFSNNDLLLGALILAAMGVQLFLFEKGSNTSAVDFNITLGGILYLGWLGSYLISLRNLPDGLWWFMVVMPAIWVGDGAAYFVGSHLGRHKMSRRASPKKSWEGYVGGVIGGALFAMLMASLWHLRAPAVTPGKGLILGLVVAAISPLGDLGESMLKRGFGVKDSSHLLPGHGGVMDRIDSWLWAAVIGYYLILYAWV
jgi:phosphatidate cytidylyltransferase